MSESLTAPLTRLTRPWRGRLVVLAGLVLIALNGRIMVAVVAPIIDHIRVDLPLSHNDEAIIGMIAPFCFAVFGALAAGIGRRFGLEATMAVALLVSAIGEACRSMVSTPVWFIIWTVPALAGAGIGNVIAPPLIRKYFSDRVTLVTGVYTFFLTISTSLPPLFILSIANAAGWRFSVGLWAVIGVAGVVPWLFVMRSLRRMLGPRRSVPSAPTIDALSVPIWRHGVTWAVAGIFTVNCIIGYTMFAWLPHVLTDAGMSIGRADMYLAVFTAGSLPGALLTPLLIAKAKRVWVMPVVFFIAYAVSLTGLAVSPTRLTLLWILVSRIGDCYFPYVLTMINLRSTSTRGSIAMSGFIQPVAYIIATIGPWGFGALQTLTGGYHIPMLAIIACLPIQLVAGILVARARPVDV